MAASRMGTGSPSSDPHPHRLRDQFTSKPKARINIVSLVYIRNTHFPALLPNIWNTYLGKPDYNLKLDKLGYFKLINAKNPGDFIFTRMAL